MMEPTIPSTIVEQRVVTVICSGEKVRIDGSPQSFSDFNSWVRVRFSLADTNKLSFRNLSGTGEPNGMFRPALAISNPPLDTVSPSMFICFLLQRSFPPETSSAGLILLKL